jgi:hypothetical protein
VVHEAAAVLERELVDEGFSWIDVWLRESANAIHAIGHHHAVPVHGVVFGQLVGYEDALLPSTASIVGPGD